MTENFNELASALEAKLTAVAEDRKASADAIKAELDKLGAKQVELAHALTAVEQKAAAAPAVAVKRQTLGDIFTASEGYKAFASGRSRNARLSLNAQELAAIVTPAGAAMQTLPGVYGSPELPTDVEAVFPHVAVSGNAVEYLKAKSETNASAFVAEAAAKPESAFEFEMATAPVRTIAAWVRISRQLADDAPAVASYISNRMAYHLRAAIEAQLIAGNGTGQNLSGIFTTGSYTAHGLTDSTLTGLDVVRKAATLVRAAGFAPSVVFLNPQDYDSLIGEKDKQGRYQFANPVAQNGLRLWGLRPVLSASITAGQFIVADPAQASVFDRMAAEVALFEQDSDNVTNNLVTIRAERRLGFGVENALAFVGGKLAIA